MARTPRASSTEPGSYYLDKKAAQRAVDFFAECLVHVKGEYAGRPFLLEPWQANDIIRPLFGWKIQIGARRDPKTDPRKYRTCYVEIPKKNGKSSISAGIGLYLLTADGEQGAEIFSAASDRDQAAIVFDVAKQMRAASPELRKRLKPYARALVRMETASNYRVLSADAPTKHGFNAHGILFDELHAQQNRDLWDVLTTSTASRRQPITFITTTAGYDRHSICREVHEYALKVREGILEQQAAKARESLAYQNTFRRLHLNQWTEQAERAIDMDAWDACASAVDQEALRGRRCFAGLDLANTSDVAALVLVFPSIEDGEPIKVLPRFWIPGANIERRVRKDRVPYDVWRQQGLIEATEGNIIDYDVIRKRIREDGERYEIVELALERWNAAQLSTQLAGDGFTMVAFGQGFSSMAAPTKEFLTLLAAQGLAHGGHPVLRWMASNFAVKQDAAGNLKPDKASSSEKIDGIVALIMGLARAIVQPDFVSVYETRGVLLL